MDGSDGLAPLGIVVGLLTQQGHDESQQTIPNTAQGAGMGVAGLALAPVELAGAGIALHVRLGTVEQSVAQTVMTGAAHRDQLGLAALFGDGGQAT